MESLQIGVADHSKTKEKAIEDARKMQASIVVDCNNAGKEPPSDTLSELIGKGSFGKVFLVREKMSDKLFAMKVLKKQHIINNNQVEHTKTERSVLGYVRHPYIVGLNMAFQVRLSDLLLLIYG